MKPQDKFKSQRCFELPREVFGLLWTALSPEARFVDKELWDNDIPHFILREEGARRACFYAETGEGK